MDEVALDEAGNEAAAAMRLVAAQSTARCSPEGSRTITLPGNDRVRIG